MKPATSERNFTPTSSCAIGSPSGLVGTVVLDQIVCAAAFTVMLSAFVVFWAPPATPIVKLDVPAAVGVPEITPVLAARVNPAGSVPLAIDQVYGGVPPLAARVVV